MKRRVAVRAIIEREGKILCAQLKPYNQYVTDEFWSLPGGGIDEGESLIPALEREIMEELGVHAIVGNLLYVQQFVANHMEHLEFFFHVANTGDFLDIDLAKTTHGADEIARLEFIDPATAGDVRPPFLITEPIAEHIARNRPARFFSRLENVSA
jgi:ADP-ribose pyrophosphatase YjhB (NUDIX family)